MALFGGLEAALKINASDFSRGLRGAQSTVTGFGRSVGSTFDSVGDEASQMGRSVVGATGGFSILEDSLKSVLVPSRLLSGQLDEVGDEASQAGRQAGMASTGFTALSISSSGLSFSLGILSTVTSSTVLALGALLTVVGLLMVALAPLIIGATALAAAFGLIIGTGVIAGFKKLKKAFAQAKKQIMPMIKAFGKQFVPFLKETIKMLPGLVKSILNAIGPMDQFFNALRTLRNLAFKFLPKFIGWFMDLGRWALPILTKLGAFLLNKVVPALRTLVKWGKQIWKIVGRWVQKFKQAAKQGTTLRTKFNKLIASLKRFWKRLQPVLKALRPFVKQLIKFGVTAAKVALDVARLAVNIGTKLLPYLTPIINLVTDLIKWFNSFSYEIKRAAIVVGALIAIFNPFSLAMIAVIGTVAALAGAIYKNWDKIKSYTKGLYNSFVGWLNDMAKAAKNIGKSIAQGLVSAYNAIMPDSLGIPSITLPRVSFSIPGLTLAGHVIYKSQSVGVGPFGPFGGNSVAIPQLATGGMIESEGLAYLHQGEQVLPKARVDRRDQPGGAQTVVVNIQTDDEALDQWVREKASVEVTDTVAQTFKQAKRRGTFN
jgi:hypothetical protein